MSDRHVIVVDIKMPFWSMVGLIVRSAIAAISAGIMLAFVHSPVMAVLSGL